MNRNTVICGDCLDVMRGMPENSVDAIVTDPPYGLSFMGKDWDHGIPGIPFWQEALRVAKPGAHMLAFGGTRTHHRLMVAIEDAGWEIRDCLMWLYGSGFPKSLDVSKAIDKMQGAEREIVGVGKGTGKQNPAWNGTEAGRKENSLKPEYDLTAPATPEARQWNGWGTSLKPAYEILILAQKPLSPRTEQVLNVASLYIIESKLWSLLPVSVAEKSFGLSPNEFVAVCDSAQWNVDERSNIQESLLGQMDISQFVSVMTLCLNTVTSWRTTLEDHLNQTNTSTTSTETDPTIDLKTLNSCLSVLTPHTIIQDAIQTHGLWQHASPAVRYLNAVLTKLNATHTLSVLDPVLLKEHILHPEKTAPVFSPNWEPVILARKPLEGTVAQNVLKWGTGGINVDGGRIVMQPNDAEKSLNNWKPKGYDLKSSVYEYGSKNIATKQNHAGRWPANLLFDEDAAAMLDEQSGESESTAGGITCRTRKGLDFHMGTAPRTGHTDSGGASRFFYTAKADSTERNKHLIGLGKKCNDGRDTPIDNPFQRGETLRKNVHPCVKPVDLLRYLCRLITPPGGVILDPFAGSGSTGIAALEEGFDYILIEIDPEYHQIAKIRNAQKRIGEFA